MSKRKPKRPKLLGLDHVAVCVRDLEAASRLFERVLGRKPAHRERVPRQKTQVVSFALGRGVSLELVAPCAGNAGLEKFLEKRGPGLHHLALRVEGLAEVLAALKADGLQLIDERAGKGAGGREVAFLHPRSAGGVLVELVEGATRRKR